MKIKEFIYIVNNKVFRVYSKDKQEAKKTIIKTASEYSKTDNDYYRKHWVDVDTTDNMGELDMIYKFAEMLKKIDKGVII